MMPRMTTQARSDWLVFAALGFMWGSSYLFIKIGVETITPLTLVTLRLAVGALFRDMVTPQVARPSEGRFRIADLRGRLERVDQSGRAEFASDVALIREKLVHYESERKKIAAPHGVACFTTHAAGWSNSFTHDSAASASSRLMYESSFPWSCFANATDDSFGLPPTNKAAF